MKCTLPVLFVLALALPAFGEEGTSPAKSFVPLELMTTAEAPIHAKADKDSAIVGIIPQSVRLVADDRTGFWYHVTYETNGETVSGWVSHTDVNNLMGRSKGQLLVENRSLYNEVVELREQVELLEALLADAEEEAKALEEKLAETEEEIARLMDELEDAQGDAPETPDTEAPAEEPATTEPAAAEPPAPNEETE